MIFILEALAHLDATILLTLLLFAFELRQVHISYMCHRIGASDALFYFIRRINLFYNHIPTQELHLLLENSETHYL